MGAGDGGREIQRLLSGHLIEHFVAHFVENGPISITCDDEVRDEVFQI